MRHRVAGKKLNRSSGHRRALFRNLVSALIYHERIETTEAKARAVRGQAEKLITLAKRGLAADEEDPARGVHARRLAAARLNRWVQEPDGARVDLLAKLFDDVAPRYVDRPGGYTRMIKLGVRRGDAAPMAVLELVEEGERRPRRSAGRKSAKEKEQGELKEEPAEKVAVRRLRRGRRKRE
jgi:large subunit ribosomal protein L17